MTDHRYDRPSPGSADWHEPLNRNFRDLDSEVVEVVETWDDLPGEDDVEQSSNGQWPRFLVLEDRLEVRVTDERTMVVGGLGSADRPVPAAHVEAADADHLNVGPLSGEQREGAAVVNAKADPDTGVVVESYCTDDGGNNAERKSKWWCYNEDGSVRVSELTLGEVKDGGGEFSIYLNPRPIPEGESPDKVFNLEAQGDGSFDARVHADVYRVVGEHGESILNLNAEGGGNKRVMFGTDDGTRSGQVKWDLRSRESRDDRFELRDRVEERYAFTVDPDSTAVDFWGNETENVAWEHGTDRPDDPATGQRFFDTELGQPVWYDGEQWVDASGDAV